MVTQCVVVLASDANAEVFTNHVFIGGTETTAPALKFCLLFMCKYPEVQEKVCKEIESQIGLYLVPTICLFDEAFYCFSGKMRDFT